MIKNFFFLNRLVRDISPVLDGSKVISAFTQEKDKLVIEIRGKNDIYLEISVNHTTPYLTLKDRFTKAKKNVFYLFDELNHKKIISFQIAHDDRIIKLTADDCSLYFTIRGKFTNVYFLSGMKFTPFKKIDDENELESIRTDLENQSYDSLFNSPDFDKVDSILAAEELRKKYPILGKEIIFEAISMSGNDLLKNINAVLQKIQNNKLLVTIDDLDSKAQISFEGFNLIPSTDIKIFEKSYDALNYFLSKDHYLSFKKTKSDLIKKNIDGQLKKITNKINALHGLIERGCRDEELNQIGKLILNNLSVIPPSSESIKLENVFSNNELITIKLDSKLSLQKNAEKYFQKAKDEKTNFIKSKQVLEQTKTEKSKLENILLKIDEDISIKELDKIMKELRIKRDSQNKKDEQITDKFKHYILNNKYNVYVGKDSQSNDLLTLKFAKQNDIWFHARSVSGSHVIIRIDNTKEPVPKDVLKKTASIAAYHSKAKTAGVVPVSYTFKKYVVKRKGMEVGKVALLREETLLVRPEIPADAEFVTS